MIVLALLLALLFGFPAWAANEPGQMPESFAEAKGEDEPEVCEAISAFPQYDQMCGEKDMVALGRLAYLFTLDRSNPLRRVICWEGTFDLSNDREIGQRIGALALECTLTQEAWEKRRLQRQRAQEKAMQNLVKGIMGSPPPSH